MSDNWVVQNLENALDTWNSKLAEIWQLITQSPAEFKGGTIWTVITNIHGAVQAIGLARVVLGGRGNENLRQLCRTETPRTCPETVYPLYPIQSRRNLRLGAYDSLISNRTGAYIYHYDRRRYGNGDPHRPTVRNCDGGRKLRIF